MYKVVSLLEEGVVDTPCIHPRLKRSLATKLEELFVSDLDLAKRVDTLGRLLKVSKLSFEQFMSELFIPILNKLVLETPAPVHRKTPKGNKSKRGLKGTSEAYKTRLKILLSNILALYTIPEISSTKGTIQELYQIASAILEKKRVHSTRAEMDSFNKDINLCFFGLSLKWFKSLNSLVAPNASITNEHVLSFIRFLINDVMPVFGTVKKPVLNHIELAFKILNDVRTYLVENELEERLTVSELSMVINTCTRVFGYVKSTPVKLFDLSFTMISLFMPIVSSQLSVKGECSMSSTQSKKLNSIFERLFDDILPVYRHISDTIRFGTRTDAKNEEIAIKSYITMLVMFCCFGKVLKLLDKDNNHKFETLFVVLLNMSCVFRGASTKDLKSVFIEKLSDIRAAYYGLFSLMKLYGESILANVEKGATFPYFIVTVLKSVTGDSDDLLEELKGVSCEPKLKDMFSYLTMLVKLEYDVLNYIIQRDHTIVESFKGLCRYRGSAELAKSFLAMSIYSQFSVYNFFEVFLRLFFRNPTAKLSSATITGTFLCFQMDDATLLEVDIDTFNGMMASEYFRSGVFLNSICQQLVKVVEEGIASDGVVQEYVKRDVRCFLGLFKKYKGCLFEDAVCVDLELKVRLLVEKIKSREALMACEKETKALSGKEKVPVVVAETPVPPKEDPTVVCSTDLRGGAALEEGGGARQHKKRTRPKAKPPQSVAEHASHKTDAGAAAKKTDAPAIKLNSKNKTLEDVVDDLRDQGLAVVVEPSRGRHQKKIVISGCPRPFPVPVHSGQPLSRGVISSLTRYVNMSVLKAP